jgi:hypothetical protein
VVGQFDDIVPGLKSVVGMLTRERAVAQTSVMMMAFDYDPPQLRLTAAERELLTAALDGATDDALARRLGVPLTSVKARWTRIEQRAVCHCPELFRHVPSPRHADKRGAQTRHLVLEYLRANPSELTPYASAPLPRTDPRCAAKGST